MGILKKEERKKEKGRKRKEERKKAKKESEERLTLKPSFCSAGRDVFLSPLHHGFLPAGFNLLCVNYFKASMATLFVLTVSPAFTWLMLFGAS